VTRITFALPITSLCSRQSRQFSADARFNCSGVSAEQRGETTIPIAGLLGSLANQMEPLVKRSLWLRVAKNNPTTARARWPWRNLRATTNFPTFCTMHRLHWSSLVEAGRSLTTNYATSCLIARSNAAEVTRVARSLRPVASRNQLWSVTDAFSTSTD